MIAFLGSILWYVLGAIVITIMVLLENEKEGWSTTLASLGIGLLVFLHLNEIVDYLQSNVLSTILFVVFYVIVGILWSFLKWSTYVKTALRKFLVIKDEFLEKEKEITSSNIQGLIDKVNKNYSGYVSNIGSIDEIKAEIAKKVTPVTNKKKSIIIAWISYWPLSLVATLLNNPFRRFFEFIYESVSGFYDKITNKHQSSVLKF